MTIKIKFFGVLAGIASTNETSFEIPTETNSDAIKEHFESIFTGFKNQQYQLALNQQLLNANSKVGDGDEIAFLPPFAGG
tara:strand:- start:562 stop:801 length:240 start_codon:yes stop_codon:yes gene_type:complete